MLNVFTKQKSFEDVRSTSSNAKAVRRIGKDQVLQKCRRPESV